MPTLQLKKGYFHSSERNENMYSEHFLPSDNTILTFILT